MKIHKRLLGLAVLLLAAGCSATSALASSVDDEGLDIGPAEVQPAAPQLPRTAFVAASVPLAEEVARRFRAGEAEKPEAVAVPEVVAVVAEDQENAAAVSPAFAMLYWTILGLHPEWRPDTCDHPFVEASTKVVCERIRDRGQKWAGQLSLYILTEAVRQGICRMDDPLCFVWFAGQGQRESGLSQGDICKVILPVAWVEEVPADAQLNERVRMCWRRGNGGRNCQKVYLRAHSDREYVVDRCAYGEVGVFQVRSHEARMGQIVPSTGEPLPNSWLERRALLLDPWRNISLAFEAFRVGRDWCCGEDQACLSSVGNWLGVFNTGKCKGTQTVRYVDKIGRAIVKAMKYVCGVLPDLTFGDLGGCNPADMANVFTPPGHPRRHRMAAEERTP